MNMTQMNDFSMPKGFRSLTANVGIRDASPDLLIVASDAPCSAAGVFTKSRFAGPSVTMSRSAVSSGTLRGLVVVSKNANVANGPEGDSDAQELAELAAGLIDCDWREMAVASTGVIGRRYPMHRIRSFFAERHQLQPFDGFESARAIMTTDTHPKLAAANVGDAVLIGVAKGVGMIEPDMATLLSFFFTDAEIDPEALDGIFRRVCDQTFNCISIDTDTSTSDSAVILASGKAGRVDLVQFEQQLLHVATVLAKMIARDGEGATKLLEVHVSGATSNEQAKRVAKSIVNSPLVKTAVHGADPNWGRVAMAIGKCSGDVEIDPNRVSISFGTMQVYPGELGEEGLGSLQQYMRGEDIVINVDLGLKHGSAVVWGCDLSAEYVAINGEYST